MKILLVNTLYHPLQIGGAEKSVQVLAEKLVTKGHSVAVVTLGEKSEEDKVNGVQVFRLKLENIYWPFGAEVSMFQKLIWHYKDNYNKSYDSKWEQIFKAFQPDIIHTHNLGGFSVRVWELAKRNQIPIFHTLRDYYLMSTSTTHLEGEKFIDRFFSSKRKKESQVVDAVSGISKFILKAHLDASYFSNAQSELIYNGFDLNISEENKVANGNLKFGFIGQVKEHKGIDLLLEVFDQLDDSNAQLLIAGEASEELQQKYKHRPSIQFLGFVKPNEFFEKIDILVVPSLWHEPFGRVVMEAVGHKVVVLGSNRGGIPELLSNNPEFIFEPDEKSLKASIEKLIQNPELLKSFQFDLEFLNNFDLDFIVNQYESVYKRLTLPVDEI